MDPKHGLTVLTRLAGRRPEEMPKLERALRGRRDALAAVALEVAVETGDPIGVVLARQLEAHPDPSLALRLYRLLPDQTIALREVAAVVTRQCLEHHRGRGDDRDLAHMGALLDSLAARLAAVGRRAEALAAAQDSVEIRRRLAAQDATSAVNGQNVAEADLAASFNTLALRQAEVGAREAALVAAQEAAEIGRRLVAADAERFAVKLAGLLNTLANQLGALGRREDALTVLQEAIEYLRPAVSRPCGGEPRSGHRDPSRGPPRAGDRGLCAA